MQSSSQTVTIVKTNIQFYTGQMPCLLHNQQCPSTERKNIYYYPLCFVTSAALAEVCALTSEYILYTLLANKVYTKIVIYLYNSGLV